MAARHPEYMVGWVHRVLGNLERWFAAGRSHGVKPERTVDAILIANVLTACVKAYGVRVEASSSSAPAEVDSTAATCTDWSTPWQETNGTRAD
jgi:hypothetical protein